eukprot:CAMPEP_0194050820 /NCGR_PEP_ID=MMETSP0009_2-20130614/37249_1 /TAXON_ID=210454 /ORGANISM="Grammatophora oceanica, Strain CCMP 410" /LENGTH=95 /DNA_ID=CAMNT_0038697635 /DNA_START=97 /DNA_END=384 /DNA_ORIENTATION=-
MADVETLTKRLEALEKGAQYDATKEAVQAVQMDALEQLRTVREAMKTSSAGGASSKEVEALKEENAKLKKINSKQAYRIEHLVSTVETFLKERKE